MSNFVKGLLTVLLWFFIVGGALCSMAILIIGIYSGEPFVWLALIPFMMFVAGEVIAFKLRSRE